MSPLPLWMKGGKKESQGEGCSPSPEAALQEDPATRREEMDGSSWEHRTRCSAHTSLPTAKLAAKGSK